MDRIKREFWKWIPIKGLFFTWLTNSFMLVTVTLYKNYIWWAKYVIGKIAIRCWQYWEKNISHWKLSLCAHVGMPNLLWITSLRYCFSSLTQHIIVNTHITINFLTWRLNSKQKLYMFLLLIHLYQLKNPT